MLRRLKLFFSTQARIESKEARNVVQEATEKLAAELEKTRMMMVKKRSSEHATD